MHKEYEKGIEFISKKEREQYIKDIPGEYHINIPSSFFPSMVRKVTYPITINFKPGNNYILTVFDKVQPYKFRFNDSSVVIHGYKGHKTLDNVEVGYAKKVTLNLEDGTSYVPNNIDNIETVVIKNYHYLNQRITVPFDNSKDPKNKLVRNLLETKNKKDLLLYNCQLYFGNESIKINSEYLGMGKTILSSDYQPYVMIDNQLYKREKNPGHGTNINTDALYMEGSSIDNRHSDAVITSKQMALKNSCIVSYHNEINTLESCLDEDSFFLSLDSLFETFKNLKKSSR